MILRISASICLLRHDFNTHVKILFMFFYYKLLFFFFLMLQSGKHFFFFKVLCVGRLFPL